MTLPPAGVLLAYIISIQGLTRPFYSTLALFFVLPLGLFAGTPLPATCPKINAKLVHSLGPNWELLGYRARIWAHMDRTTC